MKDLKEKQTWFMRNFLNNHVVTSLLIILLLLLVILVFTKVSYLFSPVGAFFDIVGFPLVASAIMFYLLYPIVEKLEQKGMSRVGAIWLIFIGLIILMIWGISSFYPVVINQSEDFIRDFPTYMVSIEQMLNNLPILREYQDSNTMISSLIDGIDFASISDQISTILNSTFGSLTSVVGTVAQVVMGVLTIPIVLFYLLLDGEKIGERILYFVPTKYKQMVRRMLFQGNYQVSQYIRGQIIVALCVGVMFSIGYSIIGLDYAIAMGVLSGILNIIPYLGSFIAVIPALIIALITSPSMLLKVIAVMMIEQTIEGRFISPQILGNSLKIHPVTILLVLLTAGKMFGVVGVILGVPGYAVIKVVITELYQMYRERSPLYEDEDLPQTLTHINHIEELTE